MTKSLVPHHQLGKRCLGKKPAKHWPGVLKLGKYLNYSLLPDPPKNIDWISKVQVPWGMMLNDSEGDCTLATAGHQIVSWTANSMGLAMFPFDSDLQEAYVAITGQEGAAYNPKTGANDNGCYPPDVLNYWQTEGLSGHKITGWVSLELNNDQEQAQGNWLFGGLYSGLALPQTAQGQINAQEPWSLVTKHTQQSLPGSWGGHAVPILKQSAGMLSCITWSQVQELTQSWLDYYADELYCGEPGLAQHSRRGPLGLRPGAADQ